MRAGMSPQRARRQRSPVASRGAAAGEAPRRAARQAGKIFFLFFYLFDSKILTIFFTRAFFILDAKNFSSNIFNLFRKILSFSFFYPPNFSRNFFLSPNLQFFS